MQAEGFAAVILATGVTPRVPPIPGVDHPKVLGLSGRPAGAQAVGRRVALIGAGGIGFDVADFLTHGHQEVEPITAFYREWGIDPSFSSRGGLAPAAPPAVPREVWLLQRKPGKPGKGLGKTTGWIHRARLQQRGVKAIGGVEYLGIDDAGLHLRLPDGGEQCWTSTTSCSAPARSPCASWKTNCSAPAWRCIGSGARMSPPNSMPSAPSIRPLALPPSCNSSLQSGMISVIHSA